MRMTCPWIRLGSVDFETDESGYFWLNNWSMPTAWAIFSITLKSLLLDDKEVVLLPTQTPLLQICLFAVCWLWRGMSNLQWALLWTKAAYGVHGFDDDDFKMKMPHRAKITLALKRLNEFSRSVISYPNLSVLKGNWFVLPGLD